MAQQLRSPAHDAGLPTTRQSHRGLQRHGIATTCCLSRTQSLHASPSTRHAGSLLGGRPAVLGYTLPPAPPVPVTGGAPLARHVEDFLKVTMCCRVVQGYGLTETCAASFIAVPDEPVRRRKKRNNKSHTPSRAPLAASWSGCRRRVSLALCSVTLVAQAAPPTQRRHVHGYASQDGGPLWLSMCTKPRCSRF